MRSGNGLRRVAVLTAATTALAIGFVAPQATAVVTVPLNSAHVGAENPGFGVAACPSPPVGKEGWWGWHFIMPKNNDFTSLTVEFDVAGPISANPFPGTAFVASPDNSHAYVWTATPDTLLSGSATSSGSNAFFNLSHVCPGDGDEPGELPLEVTKTAVPTYEREHFWTISKKVETENEATHEGYPKVWLYTDGHGDETATWTVDVGYDEYLDSEWNVSGEVKIKNLNDVPVQVTSIVDQFNGDEATPVALDCDASFEVPALSTVTCTYSEDGFIEGYNQVTVDYKGPESEGSSVAYADIEWGDPQQPEKNATVNVTDLSDLFGEVGLGSVTAPNGDEFTYSKDFTWEDYGQAECGDWDYDNTATIVETGQTASAKLLVNVQCYLYETAFAKGPSGECFIPTFDRWGWTNPVAYSGTNATWTLWAGAGQCDTSKGTNVGSVSVTTIAGVVNVTYNVGTPYLLDETHVYAGATKYPMVKQGKKTIATVAPGQYTNTGVRMAGGWVIAHAVVGVPDPSFGP